MCVCVCVSLVPLLQVGIPSGDTHLHRNTIFLCLCCSVFVRVCECDFVLTLDSEWPDAILQHVYLKKNTHTSIPCEKQTSVDSCSLVVDVKSV